MLGPSLPKAATHPAARPLRRSPCVSGAAVATCEAASPRCHDRSHDAALGLCRALTAAGIRCEAAASSKLQRPAGDRVKTDARDALHLARLQRLAEVVPVRVPTEAQEAARDLARAREAARADSDACPAPMVSDAGLLPVMALAEQAGLSELVGERVGLGETGQLPFGAPH